MSRAWVTRGVCREAANPALFDVDTTELREALRYCRRCPVRQLCDADALHFGDGGVRGGRMHTGYMPTRAVQVAALSTSGVPTAVIARELGVIERTVIRDLQQVGLLERVVVRNVGKVCTRPGCWRPARTKGMCDTDYRRATRGRRAAS